MERKNYKIVYLLLLLRTHDGGHTAQAEQQDLAVRTHQERQRMRISSPFYDTWA